VGKQHLQFDSSTPSSPLSASAFVPRPSSPFITSTLTDFLHRRRRKAMAEGMQASLAAAGALWGRLSAGDRRGNASRRARGDRAMNPSPQVQLVWAAVGGGHGE